MLMTMMMMMIMMMMMVVVTNPVSCLDLGPTASHL